MLQREGMLNAKRQTRTADTRIFSPTLYRLSYLSERVAGIEPAAQAWKAGDLPLIDTRKLVFFRFRAPIK